MKNFLKAAFDITLFQLVFILVSAGIKYVIDTTGISKQLQLPFLIIAAVAVLILLIAFGIQGIIENKGLPFDDWLHQNNGAGKRWFIGKFVSWSQAIPVILAYLFFVYMIAPTSFTMLLVLYIGLVIRNIFNYFTKKQPAESI
jgi:hypothetical protein